MSEKILLLLQLQVLVLLPFLLLLHITILLTVIPTIPTFTEALQGQVGVYPHTGGGSHL